jgi:hypothetical protein
MPKPILIGSAAHPGIGPKHRLASIAAPEARIDRRTAEKFIERIMLPPNGSDFSISKHF